MNKQTKKSHNNKYELLCVVENRVLYYMTKKTIDILILMKYVVFKA